MRRLNRKLVVALVVVLVVGVALPAAWLIFRRRAKPDVRPMLAEAAKLVAKGTEADIKKAVEIYGRVLRFDRRCDAAHVALGEIAEKQGDLRKAIGHYRAACQLNRRNETALTRLATLLEQARAYKALADPADRLITIDARNATAHYWKALAPRASRDNRRAIEAAKEATRLDPKHVAAAALLADLYRVERRWSDSETQYQSALKTHPGNVELLVGLGRLHEFREDDKRSAQKAQATYEKAIEAHPSSIPPRLCLADLLMRQGKLEEAEEQLKEAVAHNQKTRAALMAYGEFLIATGRLREACDHLEHALEVVGGEWPECRRQLVGLHLDLRQVDRAKAHLDKLPEPARQSNKGKHLEGRVLLAQRKFAPAVEELREVIAQSPRLARAHFDLGLAYAGLGRLGSAQASFQEAVKRAPSSLAAQRSLARTSLLTHRLDAAVAAARTVLASVPDDVEMRLALGRALAAQGDLAAAAEEFQKAANAGDKASDITLELAARWLAARRYARAEQALQSLPPEGRCSERARYMLVRIYRATKRLELAERELVKMCDESPDALRPRLFLASVYRQQNNADREHDVLEAFANSQANSVGAQLALAAFYQRVGKPDDALRICRKAESIDQAESAGPRRVHRRLALAAFYLGAGRKDDALRVCRQAEKLVPSDKTGADSARALLALAGFYRRAGKSPDALRLCQRAEALAGDSEAVAGQVIGLYLALKKPDSALSVAKMSAEARPHSLTAAVAVPRALLAQRKAAEAAPMLEALVKEHPHEFAPAFLLGRAYLAEKKPGLAVQPLHRAVDLRPDSVDACFVLADANFRAGDYQAAILWAGRVSTLRPGARTAKAIAASSHAQLGDYGRAVEEYRAAEPEDPTPGYYLYLAGFCQRDGKHDEAEKALRQALALAPTSPTVLGRLVRHYEGVGEPNKAGALFEQVQARKPESPVAILLLQGDHYRRRGRLSEAEKAYRRAIESDARSADAHVRLGAVLLATGRADEAQGAYRQAIRCGRASARAQLAGALVQRARVAEAKKEIDAGLKADPDSASLLVARARLLLLEAARGSRGRALEECRAACEKAIELSPVMADAYLILAECCLAERPARPRAAADALRKAIRTTGGAPAVAIRLARLHLTQNEPSEAERRCRQVLAIAPAHPDALETLASALKQKDPKRPLLQIAQALAKKYPQNPARHVILGRALAGGRKWKEAADAFRACLKQRPTQASARSGLVGALVASGEAVAAVQEARTFLERNPGSALAQELLGASYLGSKDPAKAAKAFEAAARLRPGELRLAAAAANAHTRAKQPDAALACCRAYLAKWPSDPRGHILLGRTLAGQGKLADAEKAYTRALQVDPDNLEALVLLAGARAQQGRLDQAVAAFRDFQGSHPKNARAWHHLARLYVSQRKLDDARRCFVRALSIDPSLVPARLGLGSLHLAREEYSQAGAQYERVLKAVPDHAGSLNDLAWCLAERDKDLERAKALARQALDLKPKSPSSLDTLGWVCFRRKEYDEALSHLKRSLELRPKAPGTLFRLALALDAQGKVLEARKQLDRSLAMKVAFREAGAARALLEKLAKAAKPVQE